MEKMNFCLKMLAYLNLISVEAQVQDLEAIIHDAFREDASSLDYANACLALPHFAEALKLSKKKDVLEWVDLNEKGFGGLYASLQRIKRGLK